MIPESQFLDVLFLQIRAAFLVMLQLLRQTVMKTVQLHVQPGGGAVKIQNVNSARMLASEFEARETMTPQRTPKFLFLVLLVATKLAGGLDRIHGRSIRNREEKSRRNARRRPLPLLPQGGEGRGEEAVISKNKTLAARNAEGKFPAGVVGDIEADEFDIIEPLTPTLSPFGRGEGEDSAACARWAGAKASGQKDVAPTALA